MELSKRSIFFMLLVFLILCIIIYFYAYAKGKNDEKEKNTAVYTIINSCNTWTEFIYRRSELQPFLTEQENEELDKFIQELSSGWKKKGEKYTISEKRYSYIEATNQLLKALNTQLPENRVNSLDKETRKLITDIIQKNQDLEFSFKYERGAKYASFNKVVTLLPYIGYLFNVSTGLPTLKVVIEPRNSLDMDMKNKFKITLLSCNEVIN